MSDNRERETSGSEALSRILKKHNVNVEYLKSRDDILKANNFSAPIIFLGSKKSFAVK